MTLVVDKFQSLIPFHRKSTPSGWTVFNAPCCHHRGHKPDTRKRAGIRFDGDGIVYNCFNCKFITGWQPGSLFGEKMKSLSRWMGADEDLVKELTFEALKTEGDGYQPPAQSSVEFTEKSLPEGSMSLREWAQLMEGELETQIGQEYADVLAYLIDRGYDDPLAYDFYWTPDTGYIDRVIIPFRYRGKIVGNTARKIREGRPKYLSDQHPQFVFNMDSQAEGQRYVFVVEGPFDAVSIGGVALLTNSISDQQAEIINRLNMEVIVIPDQDRAGLNLIKKAAELGWSVSFPTWDSDVKDCADAAKRYGRLFVTVDAIKTAQKGDIKINMYKKNLEKKIKMAEDRQ